MWNPTTAVADNVFSRSEVSSFREGDQDDEEELKWAALQRLPTYTRVRRGLLRNVGGDYKEIHVAELEGDERKLVLDRLFKDVEDDPKLFFDRVRRRFLAVDLEFPKVEVRFLNLTVESYVQLGSRALPTIPNFIFNMSEALLRKLHMYPGHRKKITILDDVSGIVRPSRLTLLLGPPSSGKTSLLLALAGRLPPGLQ